MEDDDRKIQKQLGQVGEREDSFCLLVGWRRGSLTPGSDTSISIASIG